MKDDQREDSVILAATLAMAGAAVLALEQAILEPDRPRLSSLGGSVVLLLVPTFALAWILNRPAVRRLRTRSTLALVLLGLFALPFAAELGRLATTGRTAMAEVILLASLRNLTLGLAASAAVLVYARLAAVASLFVVTVASALGEGPLVVGLLCLYATTGVLWLMLVNWRGLTPHAPTRFPAASATWMLIAVATLSVVLAFGPTRTATVLAGLVPTSGGFDENDPEARGGVNDGDNEVSGSERPESVGFTQSEVYLETDRPSLYDAFSETYGEPFKPKKLERMIALGQQQVEERNERPTENLRAGREFPLVRRPPSAKVRRPGERAAKALVYVKGPTPLHIPLSAYDRFDGSAWEEGRSNPMGVPLTVEKGSAWMRIDTFQSRLFGADVTHHVKVAGLDSAAVPGPAHLSRFRVGGVNRPDFFEWAQAGIVRMRDRTIPAGTVVDTEARLIDEAELREQNLTRDAERASEPPIDPEVAALARSWTEGVPSGWPRVEAIVKGLRARCVHDRSIGVDPRAEAEGDVVRRFLFETRRGPDYLFATSAAILLRSLGHRTRLVSGLYAPENRVDPRTKQTAVTAEDVHVWAEVQIGLGIFVAIEPTPGYSMLYAPEGWAAWLTRLAVDTARASGRHAQALAILAGVLAVLAWRRREVEDFAITWLWRFAPGTSPRVQAARMLRLIERRAALAGRRRPPGCTPTRWYGPIAAEAGGETGEVLLAAVSLADWAAHAPEGIEAAPDLDALDACRRVVRDWTLRRFRAPASREQARARVRSRPLDRSPSLVPAPAS